MGADVNEYPDTRETALIEAVKYGHYQCVDELLKAGASVNKASTEGIKPLNIASLRGFATCVKLLMQAGVDVESGLFDAVKHGRTTCAKLLIDVGADENETQDNNMTALHVAVKKRHDNCVNLLIDSGADVNKVDKLGEISRMIAAKVGNVDCINKLIQSRLFVFTD